MGADYNKLFFNSLNFNEIEGVNPHFICPNCKTEFTPKYKPVANFPVAFDFNQQAVFQCPKCGIQIKLYVAVHKSLDTTYLRVSVDPIPDNWWVFQ